MFNSEEDLFSLTDGLSSSYVDPNNLIADNQHLKKFPIGMDNFRPKQQNPLFKNPAFNRSNSVTPQSMARLRWKSAASKVRLMGDPWADFKLERYPTEHCIRHRYNAIKKKWLKDDCIVKLEPKQFANGAMRACFRLKKLSNIIHTQSWEHASNYVAKCYMQPDEFSRDDYFNDVKLQMDAKLWSEIYNRHNPPKKIDMFQVSVLEFADGRLYHLEHFIDGKYIKYNSNSGFVEDVYVRNTPHAFSHFTFEASGHELIVVDVQGVGDLYTDPQIHTCSGIEYGEGNLGIKGFALFFSSHVCNDVCRSLGLSQFDLAKQEMQTHNRVKASCLNGLTTFRGNEEMVVGSPSSFTEYSRFRQRIYSETSISSETSNSNDLPDISESEGYDSSSPVSPQSNQITILGRDLMTNPVAIPPIVAALRCSGRSRTESHCLDSAFSMDEALNYFNAKRHFQKIRPSNVVANLERDENSSEGSFSSRKSRMYEDEEADDSTLGRIHLELAKYHEIGRFCSSIYEDFDQDAAFFHLKQAAKLEVVEAMSNAAKIYLRLPREILPDFSVEESDENLDIGLEFMMNCAEKGDKGSLFFTAKLLDTGVGLSSKKSKDWFKALEYYQRVVNISDDDESFGQVSDDCDPIYLVLARMAELNMKGGFGLEQDPVEAASLYTDAAEKAMAFGKGRMATKYYELSEEASALCDEDF